jgi:3-phenylpropionate/cinnamic acid dioxygenase small subunit
VSQTPGTPTAARDERQLAFEIERFYYREARLLDERRFKEWLDLLTDDITYTVPARHTALVEPRRQGTEDMYAPSRELSQPGEPAFREENHLTLSLRVDRAYKLNSWTDNPPPRTRRFVSNLEVEVGDGPASHRTYTNFLLVYSRHGCDNYTYTGQRRDLLRRVDGALRIACREVILDWNVITAPSLGLFF